MTEIPATPAKVEADPTKPFKAIASVLGAVLTAVLTQYADVLPWWAAALIGAVITFLATFVTPNPLTLKRDTGWKGQAGAVNWLAVIAIAVVLLVLFLIFGVPNLR